MKRSRRKPDTKGEKKRGKSRKGDTLRVEHLNYKVCEFSSIKFFCRLMFL